MSGEVVEAAFKEARQRVEAEHRKALEELVKKIEEAAGKTYKELGV